MTTPDPNDRPMAAPSERLRGTIVVLSYARSGSSLLMQTLLHLGVPPHGSFDRPDLPPEANPAGYYEDRELIGRGLDGLSLGSDAPDLRNKAVKFSLVRLLHPKRAHQWQELAESDTRLLIPLREPAESIASQTVFEAPGRPPKTEAARLMLLMQRRERDLARLSALADQFPRFFSSRVQGIPFSQAHCDPAGYVAMVAGLVGRGDSDPSAAVQNIRGDLYRFAGKRVPPALRTWAEQLELPEAYALLERSPPDWPGLAAWVRRRRVSPSFSDDD